MSQQTVGVFNFESRAWARALWIEIRVAEFIYRGTDGSGLPARRTHNTKSILTRLGPA